MATSNSERRSICAAKILNGASLTPKEKGGTGVPPRSQPRRRRSVDDVADAEPDLLRVERLGLAADAEGVDPGARVADMQEAIAGVELEAVAEVEGDAGHDGPGEVVCRVARDRRRKLRPERSAGKRQAGDLAGVGVEMVLRDADAGADIGREAVPVAEIDVAVEEQRARLDLAVVDAVAVDVVRAGVDAEELGVVAPIRRHVGAEPVVDLITDTAADRPGFPQADAVEGQPGAERRLAGTGEVDPADVAAQVPAAAELRDDRPGRRRRRKIGRDGGCRKTKDDTDRPQGLQPAHDRFLSRTLNSARPGSAGAARVP